jgi:RNA polymerase sigma factor FliA
VLTSYNRKDFLQTKFFNVLLTVFLCPVSSIGNMSSSQLPQSPKYDCAKNEGEEARQHLLSEHLPLVRYLARQIHARLPRHMAIEDLVSAGVVGLMDAFNKFDSGKHVKFGSYAKFRICGAILDSLRQLDWSPRTLRCQSRRLEEAHNKLQAALGRHPTEPELALELRITLPVIHKLLREIDGLEIRSLGFISPDDGEELDMTEHLSSGNGDDPLLHCLQAETKGLLAQAISELSEKECIVVRLHYFEELTMKKVGIALGVGESRVSQIHAIALMRLKARMAELIAARTRGKGRAAGAR